MSEVSTTPLIPSPGLVFNLPKNFLQSLLILRSSKHLENFQPNLAQKRTNLTNFGLPCTLFWNCWTSYSVFNFFYINRRKNWLRENFRFPVFDGFKRFGMSWSRFDYFWKKPVCLRVYGKNFVASLPQKFYI